MSDKELLKSWNNDLLALAKSQGVTHLTPEDIESIILKAKGDNK